MKAVANGRYVKLDASNNVDYAGTASILKAYIVDITMSDADQEKALLAFYFNNDLTEAQTASVFTLIS